MGSGVRVPPLTKKSNTQCQNRPPKASDWLLQPDFRFPHVRRGLSSFQFRTEPPPVPVIEELEATIRVLIVLMDAVREGSAEHRMIVRQLIGVRDSKR